MLHDMQNIEARTFWQTQEELGRSSTMRGRQQRTAALPLPAFGRKPFTTSGSDPVQPTLPHARRCGFNTNVLKMSRNCKKIVIRLSPNAGCLSIRLANPNYPAVTPASPMLKGHHSFRFSLTARAFLIIFGTAVATL